MAQVAFGQVQGQGGRRVELWQVEAGGIAVETPVVGLAFNDAHEGKVDFQAFQIALERAGVMV